MENRRNNPGVFIPPPLFYVALFLLSFPLQKKIPINRSFFQTPIASVLGTILILAGFFFAVPALRRFFKTKNTLITVKPATSLQTEGIYSLSRNPMYLGLILVYSGLAFIFGNWWTFLLLPVLFALVTFLIIRPEEKYLSRAFGDSYSAYRKSTRRWL
jgi:protein-S-isoprenylcysteine O-methyltransferase Ste14